jgi:hypothetical protein
MISPGDEESPSAPLFRCFTGYTHRQAKRHALLQPGRRIDPGVLFALDELDKCPINLPGWLADSAGFGIQIDVVVHSTGQLLAKYGPPGLNTVWSTTGIKIFYGGIHDGETLQKVSLLGGTLPGGEAGLVPCIPVEYLARLPRWRALIINDDLCPVVVKFRPVWRRTRHRLGLYARPPRLAPVIPPAAAAHNGHRPIHDTAPLPPIPWPGGPAPELAAELDGDLTA